MDIEKYWDIYMDGDLLEILDKTQEFFSGEISDEIFEEYDISEVVFETLNVLENKKDFDKIILFINLIKENHPQFYDNEIFYANEVLIRYYCFEQDKKNVEIEFEYYKKDITKEFDWFAYCWDFLKYYQYTELLNDTIVNNFPSIDVLEIFINAKVEIEIFKYYYELEKLYEKKQVHTFKEDLLEALNNNNLIVEDKNHSIITRALFEPIIDKEELKEYFYKDKESFIVLLRLNFIRYMKEKNINFNIAYELFSYLQVYWNKNKEQSEPDLFFNIQPKRFLKFIQKYVFNSIIDERPGHIACIWGCIYLYDFLKNFDLISEETYNRAIYITTYLRGYYIGYNIIDIWEFYFVHTWEKPDSISETEFQEEDKIFRKSFLLTRTNYNELKDNIEEELNNIGKISKYILKGLKRQFEPSKLSQKILSKIEDTYNIVDNDLREKKEKYEYQQPVRVEPKVGRNDPCPCGSGKKYKKCCMKNND